MVYRHHPHKPHDNVLLGSHMNARYNIWISVCVVMNSTLGKHFQYLHLLTVDNYIDTTTLKKYNELE